MKKYLIILTIGLSVAIVDRVAAEEVSNPIVNSVPSLTISPDAVASGMGDVGAATLPDINAQYWNPSKYAQIDGKAGFSLSFTPWLSKLVDDINLYYMAGYYKLDDKQAISGSLRYFSLGEVILKEYLDDQGYSINPYEMAVDLGYSRMLSENLSMGVTMRYILSDLMSGDGDNPAGKAFAADIAAYYKRPLYFGRERGSLGLGAVISNIGTKISYDGGNSSYFIPTNLRLGASVNYPMDQFNALNISMDLNKLLVPTPQDTSEVTTDVSSIAGIFKSFSDAPGGAKEELQEIYGSLGLEYVYNNQFFVRGGYYYENKYKGNRSFYSLGAGFKMNMLRLDASYLISKAQNSPLDGTLRFTLAFDMEGLNMLLGR
jgi:hypothetical protein